MEEEGAAEEQTIININNFQQLNQLYNAIIITSTAITIPTTPPRAGKWNDREEIKSAKSSSDTVKSCPRRNALQLCSERPIAAIKTT